MDRVDKVTCEKSLAITLKTEEVCFSGCLSYDRSFEPIYDIIGMRDAASEGI